MSHGFPFHLKFHVILSYDWFKYGLAMKSTDQDQEVQNEWLRKLVPFSVKTLAMILTTCIGFSCLLNTLFKSLPLFTFL